MARALEIARSSLLDVRSLTLRESVQVSPELMDAISKLPSLEVLDLSNTRVSAQLLQKLNTLPNLKSLDLSYIIGPRVPEPSPDVYDSMLEAIGELHNLVELRLSGYRNEELSLNAGLAALENLKGLKILDLSGRNVSDAGLKHLSPLKFLDELDLSRTKITGPGLMHLAGAEDLRSLSLADTRIDDTALPHLRGITSLEVLNLVGTDVNSDGLTNLAGLRNLHDLDLSHTNITDDGLPSLSKLTQMRSLNLDNTNVGDKGLQSLKDLRLLTALRYGNGAITDHGVADLVACFPDLEYLKLSPGEATGHLTEKALEKIKRLRNLRKAEIGRGEQMSDATVKEFSDWFKARNLSIYRGDDPR